MPPTLMHNYPSGIRNPKQTSFCKLFLDKVFFTASEDSWGRWLASTKLTHPRVTWAESPNEKCSTLGWPEGCLWWQDVLIKVTDMRNPSQWEGFIPQWGNLELFKMGETELSTNKWGKACMHLLCCNFNCECGGTSSLNFLPWRLHNDGL